MIHRIFLAALAAFTLACGSHAKAAATDTSADPLDGIVRPLIQAEQYLDAIRITSAALAARLDSLGPDDTRTLNCLRWAATATYYGRDFRLAWQINELLFDRLEAIADPQDPISVESLILRGNMLRIHGDRAGARDCWHRAEALLDTTRYDDRLRLSNIRHGQAWACRQEDRGAHLQQAIALQRESFTLCTGPSYERMNTATWLGWLLFQSGYVAEARPYLELALREGEAIGQGACFDLSAVNGLLAALAVAADDWPRAEALFHAGAVGSEAARSNALPGLGRGSMPLHDYGSTAVCQLAQRHFDGAWTMLQKSKVAVTTDFMRISRMPYEVPGFQTLCDSLYAWGEAYDTFVDSHGHTAEAVRLMARKLSAESRVLSTQQDYLDRFENDQVSVSELQTTLDSTTAYVGWATLYTGLRQNNRAGVSGTHLSAWAYVIRNRGNVEWIPLVETADAEVGMHLLGQQADVQEMLVDAASWPSRVGTDPELIANLRKVAADMFNPMLPYLDGVQRLVIEFGTEDLFKVPLELYVLPDSSFLGDRFATVYTPSAAAYVSCMSARHVCRTSSMSALLIGAPSDLAPAQVSAFSSLVPHPRTAGHDGEIPAPELRHAGAEIDAIAEMFDSVVLEGKDASEERVNELARNGQIGDFDIIHIATHALDGMGAAGRSIALNRRPATGTDGNINMDEILYSWRLHAELVTLSACRTIAPTMRWHGELVGIAQAMIGAGAHSVIGSSWDIDDEAASLFMVRFYEDYSGSYCDERMGSMGVPMGKAEALREARMWLRNYRAGDGSRPFAHPIYWAGYILVGNPD